jgi:PAS domain S-box-containing protein
MSLKQSVEVEGKQLVVGNLNGNAVQNVLAPTIGRALNFQTAMKTPVNESLHIQMAYLASIVDSSDDAIIGKDLSSIITSWNAGAERVFGYKAEEMIGQSILRLIPPARTGEEDKILSRIRAGDRIDHFETIRVRKDGGEIEVSVTVSAIKNENGEVVGASKIARDITLLKQIERERALMLEKERTLREKAEKADRMKDEFLATLSHELRTPLSAVLGWVEILREVTPTAEELEEGLEVISRNTRAQAQLIEDLLDMNRVLMGKFRLDVQMVDLPKIVETVIRSAAPSAEVKGLVIKSDIDPLAGPVRGDATRLQQVVSNLLTNAIKFTPSGGRIDVGLVPVQGEAQLCVVDTGIGIRSENIHTIFDRFTQVDSSTSRRFSGLGLGLSIVKHLVELQGGTVRAESPGEGKGATFRVSLPIASAPSEGASQRNRSQISSFVDTPFDWIQPNLSGRSALIVEDDSDNAGVVRRLLEQCGATVEHASDGKSALEAFRAKTFDILISDIGMPEMDGFDLIRRIRALGKDCGGKIPAVALTAFSRPEDRKMAIISGFDVYLSKPADPQELLSIVDRFVRLSD